MPSSQKTLVILDTNKLRNNFEWEKDYSMFEPKGDFIKIIEFIEQNNLQNSIFIGITDMVLEELISTRCENFNQQINNLKSSIKKLGNMPCCDFSKVGIPEDSYSYDDYIRKKIEEYMSSKKFILILHLDKEKYAQTMSSIIKKFVKKEKPFSDSGKGFKDAIIWETILNLKNIDDYFSVFFLTENIKDFEKSLQEKYKETFSKDLNLETNTDLLIASLQNIYKIYVNYPEIIKFLKTDYFSSLLSGYLFGIDFKVKKLHIESILDIEDFNEEDFEWSEIESETYTKDNLSNLKNISIVFLNDSKKYEAEFVFDTVNNDIVQLYYDEKVDNDE